MTTIGAVVLAGGEGTRMGGVDKGLLRWRGGSFLERMLEELAGYPEVILSVDRADRHANARARVVVDAVPGRGPLQGLVQALEVCEADALLALAVDMPLFEKRLGDYLAAFFHPGCRAVVAVDRAGGPHPLCALYAKSAAGVLRRRLEDGRLSLRDALAELEAREAPLAFTAFSGHVLANVNTVDDLRRLERATADPPVLAVCGEKNAGKTTLIAGLVPLLRREGLRVGAIKHDGHDFQPDVPGTDSHRLRLAGAERVAVYSERRSMLVRDGGGEDVSSLLPQFRGLDIVLVEGCKHSRLPKLEVIRAGSGGVSRCCPSGLLAVCADGDVRARGVPVFGMNDYETICRCVIGWLGAGSGKAR